MADKRKLQGEIDRCLKKVNEGVEAFDDIWQKVGHYAASNSNQKEKYEADLKKEIKKLQRLRDQIKTWAASNDIKDKRPLLDARKLIETQMERFKVVERETKTKAYSKEGLGQANKIDPITKEKEECREWLNESIDRIKLQIDQMESEIESMQSGNKKKKIDREKTGKIEAHRERIEKHRFHIKSLELILRLLDNESLEVDRVNKLKEDVDYYIENCQEPDFVDDEGLYEEFDLESDLALSAELVRSPSETNRDDDDIDIPSPGSSVSSSSGYMIGMANSPSSKSITNANSPRKSKSSSTSSSNGSSINIVNNNSTTITTTSVTTTTSSNTRSKSFSTPTTTMATIATTITSIAPSSSPPPSSSLVLESTTTISTVAPALTALTTNHNSVNNKVSSISPSSKAVGQPTVTPYAVAAGANQPSLISVQKSSGNQQVCLPSPPLQTQPSLSQISTSSVLTNHVDSHQYPALSTTRSNELKLSDGLNSLVQSEILSVSQSSSPVSLPPSSTNQSESISDTTVTSSLTDVTTLPAVSTISSIQSGVSIPSSLTSISSSLSSSLSMTQNAPESITLKSISGSTDQIQIPTDYGTKSIMPVGGIYDGSSQSPVQGTTKPAPQTQEVHLQPLLGVAPLGHVPLVRERMNQLNMLEAAFHHLPQRQDSERMKPYLPRNAVPIASYHHHQPPPHIDSLEFFQRLATETLFFIFYYQEGTRAQYLAAKALKKQSWRFHTKYMMWFQRHEEPKTITDEYEQGTYIFFDFEKWSQRKREGFTFEYRYLEDKELP